MPEINEMGTFTSEQEVIDAFIGHVDEHAGSAVAKELVSLIESEHHSVMRPRFGQFLRGSVTYLNIDQTLHWASTPQGHAYWQRINKDVPMFKHDPTC